LKYAHSVIALTMMSAMLAVQKDASVPVLISAARPDEACHSA
jgi:hypothetical protein